LFKVGGELVAPQQVEQVLTGYAGVAQAYVAGVPDERLGEVGGAWIVVAEGRDPAKRSTAAALPGSISVRPGVPNPSDHTRPQSPSTLAVLAGPGSSCPGSS
jgi:acyl-CoA synthetase (AMP-forming)/AMP-acid ligase II